MHQLNNSLFFCISYKLSFPISLDHIYSLHTYFAHIFCTNTRFDNCKHTPAYEKGLPSVAVSTTVCQIHPSQSPVWVILFSKIQLKSRVTFDLEFTMTLEQLFLCLCCLAPILRLEAICIQLQIATPKLTHSSHIYASVIPTHW